MTTGRADWAVGVCTVPQRRNDLLPRTLRSLEVGGFDHPHLFIDGDDDARGYRSQFGCNVTCRFPAVRAFANFILSLAELYTLYPDIDRYVLFQDDVLCCRNLRSYLATVPFPMTPRKYLNLFTFLGNDAIIRDRPRGWHEASVAKNRNGISWQTGLGALGLVFDRTGVVDLLSARDEIVMRAQDRKHRHNKLDGAVVNALNRQGYREMIHNPSLVQHTGVRSAIAGAVRPRHWVARSFPGEDWDAAREMQGISG